MRAAYVKGAVLLVCLGLAPLTLKAAGQPWSVSEVFGGVGGFSVYGIDAEPALRPNPGDIYCWESFDSVRLSSWQVHKPGADGTVVVQDKLPDFSWSRGAGYACLYYTSPSEKSLELHLSHNGTSSIAWCDGKPVLLSLDPQPPANDTESSSSPADNTVVSETDQGNAVRVQLGQRERPRLASLPAGPGWHVLLLKLITNDPKGATLAFTAKFTDENGEVPPDLQTTTSDPEIDARLHAVANRLAPVVMTNAPFNLAYPGQPLQLIITLQRAVIPGLPRGQSQPNPPVLPDPAYPLGPVGFFSATLHVQVTDYDGHEIGQYDTTATFPGTVIVDLGKAPATGYYGVHLSLTSVGGLPIITYPPDGFNVIRGTAAQAERKDAKKMAVTYYFMGGQDRYKTLFFPYMKRMGFYRNVGGEPGKNLTFYKAAAAEGLSMTMDLWNHDKADYVDEYVKETSPYVHNYKSFNEIDICKDQRKTPEYWVGVEKMAYEAVKKYDPNGAYIGASLVRPSSDSWFAGCIQLGIDQYQDAWDVHAYPRDPPVLEGMMPGSAAEQDVEHACEAVGRKNDKPFWLGECGARCSHGFDARRWQADTVTKMAAWAMSRSDYRVIGFLVPWDYSRQLRGTIGDIEAGHMPAEAAYYTAGALIDGLSYKKLDLGKNIQAAQFGDTVLAWGTTQSPQEIKVPLKGDGPWVSVDVVGRVSPLTADQASKFPMTQSPVYFLSQQTYDRLTPFLPQAQAQN